MPLLTDLLATNTSNIAANTTAVASAGGRHKYLGTVDVTNTSTTYLEVDSTYITSAYDDYFIRVVTPNYGWSGSITQTGMYMEGYYSVQTTWAGPRARARTIISNTSSVFDTTDSQLIYDVALWTTQPSGNGKDNSITLDVHINRPLIPGQATCYYSCVGVTSAPAGVQSRGGGFFNYGYNEPIPSFRFYSQYNWPTAAKAHVYGIVDS